MPRNFSFSGQTTPLMMMRSQPSVMQKLSQSSYNTLLVRRNSSTPSGVPSFSSARVMLPATNTGGSMVVRAVLPPS